jgi:hypothetical protein
LGEEIKMAAKPYACIQGENVVNVLIFDLPSEELLNEVKETFSYDEIIESDIAQVGFLYQLNEFIDPNAVVSEDEPEVIPE